jgi:hypothetical protein
MRVGLAYDLKQAVRTNRTAPDDALEEYDSQRQTSTSEKRWRMPVIL